MNPTEWFALEADMGIVCEAKRTCTRQALYVIRVHNIDHCNRPGLDINGNKVFLSCPACANATALAVGKVIGLMYDLLPDEYVENIPDLTDELTMVSCKTCLKKIGDVHDVFELEHLYPSLSQEAG